MALETQISAKIITTVDRASLDKSIAEIEKQMGKVTKTEIKVEANTAIAQKQIQQLEATVMKANGK